MDTSSYLDLVIDVVTTLTLVLAIIVFIWEIRTNRQERAFGILLKFIDAYEQLEKRRINNWQTIKTTIRADESLKHEINDKTSSLDYLSLRIQQTEPLFAIEHGVLEYEIRSLNLLNEICRLAGKGKRKIVLVGALYAKDISYYQNRLQDLLKLCEHEKQIRLFSVPRHDILMQFPVGEFFQLPAS